MFRTLATRLTATYVFAAIVLVIIVVAAVTAFALTMFGISARDESDSLARQVPEEVRLEISRAGSLEAASADIARHLSRPGLHVVLFALTRDGKRDFLAATGSDGPDGRPELAMSERARVAAGIDPKTVTIPEHIPGQLRAEGSGPPGNGPPGNFPPSNGATGLGRPASGSPGGGRYERMRPYPYGLNTLLRLEPRTVAFAGGSVTIFPDPAPLVRTINAFWLAMIPIGAFVTGAAWLLGRYITGQALRPLVEMTTSLNRFGAGDFAPRPIVATDRNEIGELVKAYNAAVAQVGLAFEERTAAEGQMRQFIADASHELRTPLTVIMGFIDVLRRRAVAEAGASTKIYDTMLVESRRMKALIDKLIVLARLENPHLRELETVDLADVASQVVAALQGLERAPHIALESEPGSFVLGYENELHDALSNLVENAMKYAPDSAVDVRVHGDGEAAVIDVIDRGPGIALDEQAHVFDRFYRGREREETEGFGLGLAIAKRAVERAGGEISLLSRPGAGSRFTIRIPRATRAKGAALAL